LSSNLTTNTINKTRRSLYPNPYYYSSIDYDLAKLSSDLNSKERIDKMTPNNLIDSEYSVIKELELIENALGTILFAFPSIYILFSIVNLCYTCGNGEYKVLPDTAFCVLTCLSTLFNVLSMLFIFLSLAYCSLIMVAFFEYLNFCDVDSCAIGMIYGMIMGYYGFLYYLNMSCGFCMLKNKMVEVGHEAAPGHMAQFNRDGTQLVRPGAGVVPIVYGVQPPIQPIGLVQPQIIQVQPNLPNPQGNVIPQNNQPIPMRQNPIAPLNLGPIISIDGIQYKYNKDVNSIDAFIIINGLKYSRINGNNGNDNNIENQRNIAQMNSDANLNNPTNANN
jgi:hypothetical protein